MGHVGQGGHRDVGEREAGHRDVGDTGEAPGLGDVGHGPEGGGGRHLDRAEHLRPRVEAVMAVS